MNVFEDFAMKSEFRPGLTLDKYCSTLPQSELGNAYRLQIRHGETLRFLPESGHWIAFDGISWQRNAQHKAMALVEKMTLSLNAEASFSKYEGDTEEIAKANAKHKFEFGKHAIRSQSARGMMSALKLSESGLLAAEADFDKTPELINTPDATICLKNGKGYPHRPEDMLTGLTLVSYNPEAARAVWENFIADVCKDKKGRRNAAKEAYLKVALGYSLFAHNEKALMFFITGDERDETRNGRNGKSILFDVIAHALGPDYVRRFESKMICRHNGKAPDATDRLPLIGSRIAFCSELNPSDLMDTSTMKSITGEAETYVRSLYTSAKSVRTTSTLWLLTNHLPRFSTNEKAVWARVRRIVFENFFWDGEGAEPRGHWQPVDLDLGRKLKAEAEGVLAWLIEGAVEYFTKGFPEYADAVNSLNTTRDDHDPIGDFLSSCAVRDEGERTTAKDLYAAYANYAAENGKDPESQRAFALAMSSKGLDIAKVGGVVYRSGVRLNLIGQAYLQNCDPREALKFVAKEVRPSAKPHAVDEEAAVFDAQAAADAPASVNRPARVLHGEEMSDEDLNLITSGDQGSRFTLDGVVFEIVSPGSAVQLENNVIPMKRPKR